MNKVIAGAVAVLPVLVLLTACGGGRESAPAPTVTVTQQIPEPDALAPVPPQEEDLYGDLEGIVTFVRDQDSSFYAVSEATIVEVGSQICLTIGSGASLESIIGAAVDSGLTSNQTAAIIVGAVMFICPEYQSVIQNQL